MNNEQESYSVIGVMSGTSLDGLDLCHANFIYSSNSWKYEIVSAETIPYKEEWVNRLKESIHLNDWNLDSLDIMFGQFIGKRITQFIREKNLEGQIDFICSHGHTVHHRPDEGFTQQIGDGPSIANITGVNVINDFRKLDVELGGQGAPLVPVGDELLFADYDGCLNLGGFANISCNRDGARVAYDLAPANLPLNKLMQDYFNLPYDESGRKARSGQLVNGLIDRLDELAFYSKPGPKSLGVEWLNEKFYPILNEFKDEDPASLVRSILEHETYQISKVINRLDCSTVLVTGGGARNDFFMNRLQTKTAADLHVGSDDLIDYKEALIFGFLGVLHHRNEINTFSSVTGASKDSVGGKLHSVAEN